MTIVKKKKPKQVSRSVKFAEPLAEQRLYDRSLSPNAELESLKNQNRSKPASSLKDLEPPLTLVAHLDMAAKKFRAKKIAEEASVKTIKSTKSTKSVMTIKDAKDTLRKEKG